MNDAELPTPTGIFPARLMENPAIPHSGDPRPMAANHRWLHDCTRMRAGIVRVPWKIHPEISLNHTDTLLRRIVSGVGLVRKDSVVVKREVDRVHPLPRILIHDCATHQRLTHNKRVTHPASEPVRRTSPQTHHPHGSDSRKSKIFSPFRHGHPMRCAFVAHP